MIKFVVVIVAICLALSVVGACTKKTTADETTPVVVTPDAGSGEGEGEGEVAAPATPAAPPTDTPAATPPADHSIQ